MAPPLRCDPALFERNLNGQCYVVTGANSGIGWETTKQLLSQGATVVLACRNTAAAERELAALSSSGTAKVLQLDLADLDSVRSFVCDFEALNLPCDALVNNAGVMNTPLQRTAHGFELQFGVNHVGHFLLTKLMQDKLLAAATREDRNPSAPQRSRIVNVSSCFHDKAMGRSGRIDLDDPNFEKRSYDGWRAYAQSKLANVLHAQELAKRLDPDRVFAASIHPGWVRTRLARHSAPLWVQNFLLRPFFKLSGMIEPRDGAQTSLHVLLSDTAVQHNGAFFSQRGIYRDKTLNRGGWPLKSPNPNTHDSNQARGLWQLSEALVQGR
jgi:NAD(P)-dependent dehydrogenase (short-subunit alcohol dehydrogenase family)